MKAIVIHGYGSPEVLKYEGYPDPVPSAGVSGTVESVGPGVTTVARGDKVFAHASETCAALCVVKATDVAKIPIPLGERFSLKDAGKAHAAAEKGGAGKILLLV